MIHLYNKKLSPEWVFLSFGFLLGMLSLFIMPPFQIPDEQTHFFRAYQVSDGQLISSRQGDTAGGLIPASISSLPRISGFERVHFHPEIKTSVKEILDSGHVKLTRDKKRFVWFANVVPYPPVPYFPQAIGLSLGKLFDASPLILMYLGRFFNLCMSLLLITLAIRLIPIGKWIICLVALMPIAISEMASLSADSLTNSLSWLFIALVVRHALQRDTLDPRQQIIILVMSVLLSLVKLSYLPLLALLLLIPHEKLVTRKRYYLALFGIAGLSLMAAGGWALLVRDVYVPESWNGGNPDEQIRFILSNPLFLVSLIVKFTWYYWVDILNSFGQLGWLDTPLPNFLMNSWWGVLLLVALVDSGNGFYLTWKQKVIILLVIAAVYIAILALLYVCCTPPGGMTFLIQGRYLLPIAPLFLLLLQNHRCEKFLRTKYEVVHKSIFLAIPLFIVFSSIVTFSTLIERFY